MNIFELATLDEATAYNMVRESLRRFPDLNRFYDDEFIRRLIPRRRNLDNFLLLLLVQPDEDYPNTFWTSTVADLSLVAAEGAWASFKPKFRRHEQFDLQSAKSELSLAAWVKGRGVALTLEPRVNGKRACEFMANTSPNTWWELKSLRDIDVVEQKERVYLEVQNRLRRISQPYILSVEERSTLALQDVAAAVRDIKRQIAAYYEAGGRGPQSLESRGLYVTINGMTRKSHGYLGTSEQQYVFGSEQMNRVLSRISSATNQLPTASAGIVAIDGTMAQWLHQEDVVDACFGEEVLMSWGGRRPVNVRKPGGVFHERHRTRISAVAYYRRQPDCDSRFEMAVLHNPYASVPLPAELLRADGVRQTARVDLGRNMFRLDDL